MNLSKLAVVMVPLLGCAPHSYADPRSDETLVVLAKSNFNNSIEDIPTNITVISAEEIAASGVKTLDSLLRGRAGIQISDTNSGPSFSLRGFSGEQASKNTLIILDGRRLNRQDISSPQVSSILVSQIERVEIMAGSGGVLYGDQAVGGVINIITKKGAANSGSASFSVGSFDSVAGSVDFNRKLSEEWQLFLSASQDNSDNYRAHNKRESGLLLGRLSYERGAEHFSIEASYHDNNREIPGSLTEEQYNTEPTLAARKDYSHDKTKVFRLGYQYPLTETWIIDADMTFDDTAGSGTSYSSPFSKNMIQRFGALTLEHQFVTSEREANLLIGLEGADNDFSYQDAWTDRAQDQQMVSVYGQVSYPLYSHLSFITGARYSAVEDKLSDKASYPSTQKLSESQDAYELGFNYKLSDTQRVYVRAETNFRFAKIDEQAYTSPGVLGLKPQTGQSFEAGWQWVELDHSLKVDVYRLTLKDEIVFDNSAPKPTNGLFDGANVNADQSKRYGVSLSGDTRVTQDIVIGAEYHWIDAEFIAGKNIGKTLPWVAKNSARLYTDYYLNESWRLFLEGVYTGKRFRNTDSANKQEKMSAYWLGNVALSYLQSNWSASLRVDNLFDKKYPASAYYSNFGSSYYLGDSRKLQLTVTYNF